MKDWVQQKLEAIDEFFPAERLTLSKERWSRLWNGEKPLDRYPFVFTAIAVDHYGVPRDFEDWLRAYLDEIVIRGRVADDYIPTIWSGCRQSIMPSIFGAPEVHLGEDYCCERILRSVADIDSLPEPSIQPRTPAYEVVTLQEFLLAETEGRIPIHVVDMQGPADVCGKMWGYDNLFLCAQEQPEMYHRLMTKVTEGFIWFWKRQQELLGDCFVPTHFSEWVPLSAGATASVDSMVMLSPTFYKQFYQPYIMKIGETFGGVTVHACGWFTGIVKNICQTPFLKGINASEMLITQMLEAGFDNNIVLSTWCASTDAEKYFDLIRQFSLRCDLMLSGLWPAKGVPEWDEADWQQIYAGVEKAENAAHL